MTQRWTGRRASGTRAGITVAVLIGFAVGCGPATPGPAAGPGPSGAPGPGPGPSGTVGPPGPERAVPVYYVVETSAGPRLQREFRRLPGTDDASDAVREMLAGPAGIDPDLRSAWPAGTRLRAPVRVTDGVITVDLTGLGAGAQVGTSAAEATVQQLVHTVQGALGTGDPVRILVDGEPVPELFGAVDTSAPVGRGDPYETRSLVQIDAPAHGSVVGTTVEVTGEAAVFEATLLWDVLRDGEVVRSGFTSTSEGQRFAPFSFTVDLEPGEYVVRISEDDPSGGEGRVAMTDDKSIIVR